MKRLLAVLVLLFLPLAAGIYEPRVLVLNFNPVLEAYGSQTLIEYYSWQDVDDLISDFEIEFANATSGNVSYQFVEQLEIDGYIAPKVNGYNFTDSDYLACVSTGGASSTNCSNLINYTVMLMENNVCDRVNQGNISEVWVFGGPYMGMYEANMAGPTAWWTNGPVVVSSCSRNLHIMGFNYEREVGEMLHSMSHRFEGTMRNFVNISDPGNVWDDFDEQRFRYGYDCLDQPPLDTENQSCGNVHFPPNALCHYDTTSLTNVQSDCDDWYNYPQLTGAKTWLNCTTWGCNELGFLKWWMWHFPDIEGWTNGTRNDWWFYLMTADSPCGVIDSDFNIHADAVANSSCLIVNASNIVIRGNGHTITGPGFGSGINVTGFENITLIDIRLENFSESVHANETIMDIHNSSLGDIVLDGGNLVLLNSTYAAASVSAGELLSREYLYLNVTATGSSIAADYLIAGQGVVASGSTSETKTAREPLDERKINSTGTYLIGYYQLNITNPLHFKNTTYINITQAQHYTVDLEPYYYIYLNEDYTFTDDLDCFHDCILVNASGLTIDGAGYSITGPGTGVNSTGYNVTIINLTISFLSPGIVAIDSTVSLYESITDSLTAVNSSIILVESTILIPSLTGSTVTYKKPVTIYVEDTLGSPIASPDIQINSTISIEETGTASATGYYYTYLTEYVENATDTVFWTPHNITASKTGYYTNSSIINISESQSAAVTLQEQEEEDDPPSGGSSSRRSSSSSPYMTPVVPKNNTLKNITLRVGNSRLTVNNTNATIILFDLMVPNMSVIVSFELFSIDAVELGFSLDADEAGLYRYEEEQWSPVELPQGDMLDLTSGTYAFMVPGIVESPPPIIEETPALEEIIESSPPKRNWAWPIIFIAAVITTILMTLFIIRPDKLDIYVRDARKKGFSDKEIRQRLLKSGWPEDKIEKRLRR